MLTLPPGVRVFVATERVDGRKGIDGLSVLVRSRFAEGPGGNNGSRLMSDGNSPAVSRALAARWLWWTKFALDTCC